MFGTTDGAWPLKGEDVGSIVTVGGIFVVFFVF